MPIILTPPPIALTRSELDARIRHLGRALERAESRGDYLDAEDLRDALDVCEREIAERGAYERDALVRSLDAYDVDRDAVLASVFERR